MNTRNLKLLALLMLVLFLSGAALPESGTEIPKINASTSGSDIKVSETGENIQESEAVIQETSVSVSENSAEVSESGDSVQQSEAVAPETDELIPESDAESLGAESAAYGTDTAGSETDVGNSFDIASFLDYFSPELETMMEVLGLDSLDPAEIESLRIETVFESVKDAVRERYIGPLRALAAALSGSMVISAVGAISPGKSTLDRLLSVAGVLYFSAMALYPLQEAFRSAAEVISSCQEMLVGYIPVFASIVTAAGSPVSAAAYSSMLLLSSNLAAKLFSGYIVPLSLLLLVISMAAPFTPFDVGKITAMLKKAAVWSLSFSMVIYTGILGLKTLVGSSADSVVDRSAKFVIGTFIPIVGGALSDAMNTAQGCLRLARN
nr:hypothetical protein [Oscillospiraceae bacterium]